MFHIFLLRKIIYQINIMINIAANRSNTHTIHRLDRNARKRCLYISIQKGNIHKS